MSGAQSHAMQGHAAQRPGEWSWSDYLSTLSYFAYFEVKKRYADNILGLLWSALSPLVQLGTYVFVFAVVLDIRFPKAHGQVGGALDFTFYVLMGLVAWQLLVTSLTGGLSMIHNYAGFIRQPNFPYRMLPMVVVLSTMPGHLIGLLMVLVLALVTGALHSVQVPLLLLVYGFSFLFLCGLSTTLGFLVVKVTDLRHAVPLVLNLLMFLSPILYKPEQVPAAFQFVTYANPLAYYVATFKYALTGDSSMCIEGPLVDLVVLMLMGGFFWAIQGVLWRKIRTVGIDDVA